MGIEQQLEKKTSSQTKRVIEYSARYGGVCECGTTHSRVTTSPAWLGTIKLRIHKCQKCGAIFHSTQVDNSSVARQILAEAMA